MIDIKEFKNPSSMYRGVPFWSLNGKLEKKELKKQIKIMKQMGFGGAFLHSRTGLKTRYMSKRWLSLISYCVDVLKENKMEAYLYDEDRWPSGTCGGIVTFDKSLRQRSLAYKIYDGNKINEDIIAMFKIKLGDNKKIISYKKINKIEEIDNDESIVYFYEVLMHEDPFYNNQTYIDTLNPKSVDTFIKLTHEKYKEVMGERFNKDIKGIFTDEPHRGPLFTGFGRLEESKEREIPYTKSLFEEFYKRKGYKLEDVLPVIYFGKESDEFVKETYDYIEVVQELFLEGFAKPYHNWCKENNLMFTGHILHEDNLASQTTLSGSVMRFYEYMDYPGVDNLCANNYAYNVISLVNSIAKQLEKKKVLDELYGVSGWNMNLKDYKRIGDWQQALGVSLRCPHLLWYTMEGEAKRDCPASIFKQSAWYLKYHYIEDYFARLNYFNLNSEDTTHIAIINPIESSWGLSNIYTYKDFFDTNNKILKKIETQYYNLFKDIRLNGLMVDYIDEGVFYEHGSVDKHYFKCGKKSYDTIIINGNYNLRSSTLKALKSFIRNNGKVIIVGDYPCYLDGIKHDFIDDLKGSIKIDFDTIKLVSLLKDESFVSSSNNIIVERKKYDDGYFYFMVLQNPNNEEASFKMDAYKYVYLIDLRNGEIYDFNNYQIIDNKIVFNYKFEGYLELAILTTNHLLNSNKIEEHNELVVSFNEFKYELEDDNMLILNKPSCYIDSTYFTSDYILNIDRLIREKYGLDIRSSNMVQPWFKEKYYEVNKSKLAHIKLSYEVNMNYIPSSLYIMLEKQANNEIFINGNKVNARYYQSDIDICYKKVKLPINYFVIGKNIIDIEFDFYESSNLEASFLCGQFGVFNDTISKLNDKLKAFDLTNQGLPYYGGKIKLYASLANGSYKASLNKMDLAYMSINDSPIISSPLSCNFIIRNNKIEIEAILNRYNCFAIEEDKSKIIKQEFDEIRIYK